MAPTGWHVFAGLTVSADRSVISAVVCLSNMVYFLGLFVYECVGEYAWRTNYLSPTKRHAQSVISLRVDVIRFERWFDLPFPWWLDVVPNLRVDHAVDGFVERYRALEGSKRSAVVIAMKL